MTRMDLSMKQKQRHREQTDGLQRGGGWNGVGSWG